MKLPTSDAPAQKTALDKIITATPVVMTVLATILAGLSSSEMSQAQYFRSLAAEHQSKASDQWAFFQAKKIRSADAGHALQLIQNLGDVAPVTPENFAEVAQSVAYKVKTAADTTPGNAAIKSSHASAQSVAAEIAAAVTDAGIRPAFAALRGELPAVELKPLPGDAVRRAVGALKRNSIDTIDPAFFVSVTDKDLRMAFAVSEENALVSDDALTPASKAIAKLQEMVNRLAATAVSARLAARTASGPESAPATTTASLTGATATDRSTPTEIRQLAADLSAGQLRFESARLARDAEINQTTAYLYDVAVQRNGIESDRHRTRSRYFFFGMLGAQAAVTIASVALAAKEKSTLWILAAGIGLLAMAYAGYVYLFT